MRFVERLEETAFAPFADPEDNGLPWDGWNWRE
jgi:hypothetical protein